MRKAVQFTSKGLAVTTSTVDLLANSATSESIYEVTSLICTNIDGTNSADFTLSLYDYTTATSFAIASTKAVAADTYLEVITNAPLYLQPGDKLTHLASANGDLSVVVTYRELANV